MSRMLHHPGYAWLLIWAAGVVFYLVTGSVRDAAVLLLLEIGFWFVAIRQSKKRTVHA
jgi:hypothetical protein